MCTNKVSHLAVSSPNILVPSVIFVNDRPLVKDKYGTGCRDSCLVDKQLAKTCSYVMPEVDPNINKDIFLLWT